MGFSPFARCCCQFFFLVWDFRSFKQCKNNTQDYGAYLLLSLIMLFMTWNNQISAKIVYGQAPNNETNRFVSPCARIAGANSKRFNGLRYIVQNQSVFSFCLSLSLIPLSHAIILHPTKDQTSDVGKSATEVGYFVAMFLLVNWHYLCSKYPSRFCFNVYIFLLLIRFAFLYCSLFALSVK